jgi:flagellar hook-associated protein 3 FlgL
MTSIFPISSHARVTQGSAGLGVMQGLEANVERLGRLQAQLSSGKQVSRPSDGPSATLSAMRLRSALRTHQQYARNADDGAGWLSTTDTAITTALTMTQRARDLTLQGMSAGAASATSAREGIAIELTSLREGMIKVANTRYLDRPVFGGTTTGSIAYDSSSGAYAGDSNQVLRTVSASGRVRADITGPEAFGSAGSDLFSILADIADRVASAPDTLGSGLDDLDAAMSRLQTGLADVGARAARMEQLRQSADDQALTLRTQISDVEDVDLSKTIMDLQMQEVAYQAALGAASRVLQPSLVEFLR